MTSQRHTPLLVEREIPEPVLAATRDSVLAVGVRRTTLTDVARRAGVSRMTLYRLVPDVTSLILAVMAREFAALLETAETKARRRRTARARIVATVVEVARALPDEPLFRRVVDVDPELLLPYLTDRVGATQRLAAAHLRRMLAEGMADGSVRRADLDVLALTMVLAVAPYVVSARLLDDVGREPALEELAHMLEGWLRP
jgi:AcrR family transcriptional regulator